MKAMKSVEIHFYNPAEDVKRNVAEGLERGGGATFRGSYMIIAGTDRSLAVKIK